MTTRMSSAELVADIGDQRQLLGFQQFGDLFDQPGLLHLVGDLGDHHDPGAALLVFLAPAGAHTEGAAPRPVSLDDVFPRFDDDAAGREVRSLDQIDQGLDARLGRLDEMQRRIAKLGGVMRRDIGRHAHRDARGTVGQEVGEGAGQHHRLPVGAVIGRAEVDRVLVDAVEQQPRHLGHARLGVAHGRGAIAVDIAEVPLPVDQRIARGEILRQPHQRVVDRLVAVGVEAAHHVADDLGGLLETAAGIEAELAHAVEDAPVHRLQPIAEVGQRPVGDGGKRISEVALLQSLAQVDGLDIAAAGRNQVLCHAPGLARKPLGFKLFGSARRVRTGGQPGSRTLSSTVSAKRAETVAGPPPISMPTSTASRICS